MKKLLSILLAVELLLASSARAQVAEHGAFLTWTAPVVDATHAAAASYNIYRSTAAGGPYVTPIASSTITSYVDPIAGLVVGQTYYYVVRPVNAVGVENVSGQSSEVSGSVPSGTGTITGLQVVIK